jgi:hypothetical protein
LSLKNQRDRQGRSHVGGGFPNGFGTTKTFGRKRRSIVGPILIACAVLAVLVAADQFLNSGKIYRGVEVGDVALGGSTPAEAKQLVQERATGALKEIEFSGPEQFTRTSREMGVTFNVDPTVEKAYAVGREGNPSSASGSVPARSSSGCRYLPTSTTDPGKRGPRWRRSPRRSTTSPGRPR